MTSVFQTLRVSGQAVGPLLGAPALVSIGFRNTISFCGLVVLALGSLTVACYLPRIKEDPPEPGRDAYAQLAKEEEEEGEQESLLRGDGRGSGD